MKELIQKNFVIICIAVAAIFLIVPELLVPIFVIGYTSLAIMIPFLLIQLLCAVIRKISNAT
jgi:hypothetical protein